MKQTKIAQLTFTEAHSDDEVFMRVSIISDCVEVLLTTRHHGDIDVCLYANECNQILQALEVAAREAQSSTDETRQNVANLRFRREGTTLESVSNIGVERGLVVFYLALEGDEDEEDMVWVYLTNDQCKWLIEALKKAGLEAARG